MRKQSDVLFQLGIMFPYKIPYSDSPLSILRGLPHPTPSGALPFRLNGRGASFAGSLLPLPCGVTRHSKTIINCFETAHPRREPSPAAPSEWDYNVDPRLSVKEAAGLPSPAGKGDRAGFPETSLRVLGVLALAVDEEIRLVERTLTAIYIQMGSPHPSRLRRATFPAGEGIRRGERFS